MRTVIDLTEDDSPSREGGLPFPASISRDGDDVVLDLRETEFRLSLPQFVDLVEAGEHWLFRGARGDDNLNDPDYVPVEELERLRKVVGALMNVGTVGKTEIPQCVRDAVRWELSRLRVSPENWRAREEALTELREENERLREEIAARGKKKRGAT